MGKVGVDFGLGSWGFGFLDLYFCMYVINKVRFLNVNEMLGLVGC